MLISLWYFIINMSYETAVYAAETVGYSTPEWMENILRNMDRVFGVGHKYYNWYFYDLFSTFFCYVIAKQYFKQYGYNTAYMERLCRN